MPKWSHSPDIECPNCHNKSFQSDYFELKLDSEVECSSCKVRLIMVDEDITRTWAWEVKRDSV